MGIIAYPIWSITEQSFIKQSTLFTFVFIHLSSLFDSAMGWRHLDQLSHSLSLIVDTNCSTLTQIT
jgi:hypothetical protein